MQETLSIDDLFNLAEKHNLGISAHYPEVVLRTRQPPKPKVLHIWFHKVDTEAWETLMTKPTEVPVDIYGTRIVGGSGAIDGTLYPEYAAMLKEVNASRTEIGLQSVRN